MKAVVLLGNNAATVQDFPEPKPGPSQLLVRLKASGVCGSDLHKYHMDPAQLHERAHYPTPGHEAAGVVEAVGAGVERFKPGDRVLVYLLHGCGNCRFCIAGDPRRCPQVRPIATLNQAGTWAELIVAGERQCLPLPDTISYVDGACMACSTGTAFEMTRKLAPSGLHTITIFGLGPIGLTGVMMAKALGARVIGVDIVAERVQRAHEFGADYVINGKEQDPVARVWELTEGNGSDLAWDASGSPVAQNQLVESLGFGGKGGFVGGALGRSEKSIDPSTLMLGRELTLMGSSVWPIRGYWDMAAFMTRHHVSVEPFVTHRFAVEDGPEALKVADSQKAGKTVFVWPE